MSSSFLPPEPNKRTQKQPDKEHAAAKNAAVPPPVIEHGKWTQDWGETTSAENLPHWFEQGSSPSPSNRYIPRSGGGMGWVGNQGVLANEMPNNYRYYTVPDKKVVRMAEFMRMWEDQREMSRLSSSPLPAYLGNDGCVGYSVNISLAAMELCFVTVKPPSPGSRVKIKLEDRSNEIAPIDIQAGVAWVRPTEAFHQDILPNKAQAYAVGLVFLQTSKKLSISIKKLVVKYGSQHINRQQVLDRVRRSSIINPK